MTVLAILAALIGAVMGTGRGIPAPLTWHKPTKPPATRRALDRKYRQQKMTFWAPVLSRRLGR